MVSQFRSIMTSSVILLGIAGSSLAGAQVIVEAAPATAGSSVAAVQLPIESACEPGDSLSPDVDGGFDAKPIDDVGLQAIAGRENTTLIAQADQAATSADNRVGDNSRTGDITISDAAFQNASGLTLLNINSGNNVAINASINVNIAINPPAPQ